MKKTKIDWCDSTWNPVTGCLHGCPYCYAKKICQRFGKHYPDHSYIAMRHPPLHIVDHRFDDTPYPYSFEPTFHSYRLNEYDNVRGKNIFVCSMADLFGPWVPDDWIYDVLKKCRSNKQNNYFFLTKNPKRYACVPCQKNLWYGTTITCNDNVKNIKYLPAFSNTFVSMEPLQEDVAQTDLSLSDHVRWVIVGAETGNKKDKILPDKKWIEHIVQQCRKNHIPVFLKESLADIWQEPLIQEFPNFKKG